MTQIQELVLKIHSRCNIACDHCYMYELADQSWKSRPTVISEDTVTHVAQRLSSYAETHRLDCVSVILHGGEPLLVGPGRLRHICAELTRILSPVTTVDLRMHTNGMLLHGPQLEVLREFDVKVGISLDGDRAANDRHRLDRRGRSSYDKVLAGIERLCAPEYRHLYTGLLCTVDIKNDPVAVHDALTALAPPRIDYLLPHSTWDSPPPPGITDSPTPYAEWLLRIFDRWEEQGRPMKVRTFDSVLSTLRGGPSLTEAMGLAPSDLAVVETDGTIEQADSLKAAYDGAPATGYDVFRHGFEEYARHPGVQARQSGIEGVSETCRRCPVVESCGGGLYAHRYSTERGFGNPSVFCADLRAFVEGVAERITERALAPALHDGDELAFAQIKLTRDLLMLMNDRAAGDPGSALDPDWAGAWQALLRLDADDSTAPELDAVLSHPYTRTAVRHAWDGPPQPALLATLVVAMAARAQAGAALTWEHPAAWLHLPTLGTLELPGPGRVEVTTDADGILVRHTGGEGWERVLFDAEADSSTGNSRWRPVQLLSLSGHGPLIDDAHPFRDCFPFPAAEPLDLGERDGFRGLLERCYALLDERLPGWRGDPRVLVATTVTPLSKGAGVQLGRHAPGALGVAVDAEPEDFVRQVPRLGRRARLAALRDTTELAVPGSRAGRLLDEASEALASVSGESTSRNPDTDGRAVTLKEAHRALTELAALPERQLTGTGAALAVRLWDEWRERTGRRD
ncbi:radical SAM/SPASM protein FxsB, inactivated metallohydrolase extension form [Streptomyces sp. ADMS]|uniref:radical SAM/SPASM protein FxsBH, inactivated beta-hydroxylase extension form n=1 Tax=Streptomyces sp. ADMS TaxID=3071415 RepID=UPI00296FE31E|nr:radical SAM/SPASM protein FxsB, inactivated metallohydrolase extension form [Streptomyces sp. ADMS]MDW4910097.1 radical SAM/SPASM protein FxsB, inactivated metallohydrolase extension form [Streptomyces sp. ADMS]